MQKLTLHQKTFVCPRYHGPFHVPHTTACVCAAASVSAAACASPASRGPWSSAAVSASSAASASASASRAAQAGVAAPASASGAASARGAACECCENEQQERSQSQDRSETCCHCKEEVYDEESQETCLETVQSKAQGQRTLYVLEVCKVCYFAG